MIRTSNLISRLKLYMAITVMTKGYLRIMGRVSRYICSEKTYFILADVIIKGTWSKRKKYYCSHYWKSWIARKITFFAPSLTEQPPTVIMQCSNLEIRDNFCHYSGFVCYWTVLLNVSIYLVYVCCLESLIMHWDYYKVVFQLCYFLNGTSLRELMAHVMSKFPSFNPSRSGFSTSYWNSF